MECLSHQKKLLVDHLRNTYNIGKNIYINNKPSFANQIDDIILDNLLKDILLLHDFGKATIYFQNYLKSQLTNSNGKLENIQNNELKNHSLLSALYASYDLFHKFRNELASLICYVVVSKHHGNLEDIDNLLYLSNIRIETTKKQF